METLYVFTPTGHGEVTADKVEEAVGEPVPKALLVAVINHKATVHWKNYMITLAPEPTHLTKQQQSKMNEQLLAEYL